MLLPASCSWQLATYIAKLHTLTTQAKSSVLSTPITLLHIITVWLQILSRHNGPLSCYCSYLTEKMMCAPRSRLPVYPTLVQSYLCERYQTTSWLFLKEIPKIKTSLRQNSAWLLLACAKLTNLARSHALTITRHF